MDEVKSELLQFVIAGLNAIPPRLAKSVSTIVAVATAFRLLVFPCRGSVFVGVALKYSVRDVLWLSCVGLMKEIYDETN